MNRPRNHVFPPARPSSPRSGMALFLVLMVAVIMFAGFGIVHQMFQRNVRQHETADSYVRSIFIAEAGFHRIMARLKSTGWEARWFAGVPAVEEDVAFAGGAYTSMVSDSPNTPRTADIWIKGSHGRSNVWMTWRITYEAKTLNLFPQIHVVLFRYENEGIDPDPSSLDPLVKRVEDTLDRRNLNGDQSDTLVTTIKSDPTLGTALDGSGGAPASGDIVATLPGGSPQAADLPGAIGALPGLPDPTPNDPSTSVPVPTAGPSAASGSPAPSGKKDSGTWWPKWSFNPWSRRGGWGWGWFQPLFRGRSYKGKSFKGWGR